MAEPYIEQVEFLDVLTKTGKKRAFPSPGTSLHSWEMSIEMGITIKQSMSGFLLRVHKNYFSKNVQTARTRG
ncbi:hypothetical protein Gotur_006361, partial [Gossypium turneri]